jgi:hypothetical protein
MNNEQIDLSWTDDLHNIIHSENIIPVETVKTINVQAVFVNKHFEIIDVLFEDVPLTVSDNESSALTENVLLKLIHKHKDGPNKTKNVRYKLLDILQYIVTIDTESIEKYSKSKNNENFFKSFSLPQNITIPPTFTIFHSLNTIWLIFKELTAISKPIAAPKPIPNKTIISILKKNDSTSNKITKRVRISPEFIEKKHSTTSKTSKIRIL